MPYMYSPMQYKTVPLSRDFIPSLGEAKQQVLWIGCSDSSYEEITTLDLLPDETIVLRDIGNMFLDNDLTCLSELQYAVEILQVTCPKIQRHALSIDVDFRDQVKHIVVCGHYGCGLVKATSDAGLIDPWLRWVAPFLQLSIYNERRKRHADMTAQQQAQRPAFGHGGAVR